MIIEVVSDVHGAFESVEKALERCDTLIIAGDLLDLSNYEDPGQCLLGELFGAESVMDLGALRAAGSFKAIQTRVRSLWAGLADPADAIRNVVSERYTRIIRILRDSGSLVTLGNVDVPSIWNELAPPDLRYLDGDAVEVGGLRFGFVAGGALKNIDSEGPWKYFDRTYEEYMTMLTYLKDIDVVVTHVPPRLADARFDLVAGREEMYAPGLLELIEDQKPALALFGHVHHPRKTVIQYGITECRNVGYFRHQKHGYAITL